MVVHRVRTWLHVRALDVRCVLTGHAFGRHFTALGVCEASDEAPWCKRCGRGTADLFA